MENNPNWMRVEIIRNDDIDKNIKRQSKLTFIGIHKSYEIYDSNMFKQNEVFMDKPMYLGFRMLELSKLLM